MAKVKLFHKLAGCKD